MDHTLTARAGVMCAYDSPPSLRSSASHTVFHLTFNLSQFTLTGRTLYHRYLYAVESNIVPEDKLVPLTFSPLKCTFVRNKRCAISKRFHNDCVIPSERYSSTRYATFCASPEEAIATLCDEKIIGGVNSVIGPCSKYKPVCSFKPKQECYDVIIYCLSASCDVCMYVYTLKDT